jgi:hypothetical protein
MKRVLWDYSGQKAAVEQRIRNWAAGVGMRAVRRRGRWFILDGENHLQTSVQGLDNEEAIRAVEVFAADVACNEVEGGAK